MGNIAIRIENIGKRYQLGNVIDLSRTFRETLIDLPRFLWHKTKNKVLGKSAELVLKHNSSAEQDALDPDTPAGSFWALRDINLEIKHGEVVGIIGRNGAGKSTLLKIISRITSPTTGKIELYGRVGSLLEVGTGFHPELSGRENIYLNGAILGMRKTEIDRKFDEIVAFAETEKFLDTPIKKYSSGMRVRLAFAVAAHLDPEILIVDEVLAVGDAVFQKKCLGKMGEVAKEGRTVLFVSHNMQMISALCSKCVLLEYGAVSKQGNPADTVLSYFSSDFGSMASFDYEKSGRVVGDKYAVLLKGALLDKNNQPRSEFYIDEEIKVVMTYKIKEFDQNINYVPNFHFKLMDGNYAFIVMPDKKFNYPRAGVYMAACTIPARFLNDCSYTIGLSLTSFFPTYSFANFADKSSLCFCIKDKMELRNSCSITLRGCVRPNLEWTINTIE